MKTSLYKRILSALLAVIALAGCVFMVGFTAGEDFCITHDGAPVNALSLPKNEKITVSAAGLPDGAQYQWQINIPGSDTWVDIYGQNEANLGLSYALLGSMLDENGLACVRCAAVGEGEESAYTEALSVAVTDYEVVVSAVSQRAPEIEIGIAPTDEISEESAEEPTENPVIIELTSEAQAIPAAAVPNPEDTEIVSVTIEYHYVDRHDVVGEMVMDPYVARIKKGDPLNVVIPCRVFPGYEILLGGSYEGISLDTQKNELTVSLSSVSEDTVYRLHYKEILVPYFARFFMQNVYNDLYTEKTDVLTEEQKEAMKGYAGEQPDDSKIHPEVPGFSVLFHQPDKISADGSTVFEVYYDRNYYLVNFDLDGGFGTAPVYARYETSFTVAAPTKPGYQFMGWQLVSGSVPEDAEKDGNGLVKKIPASSLNYKAVWKTVNTTYSVVYWKENAEDNGYTFWGVDTKTTVSGSRVNGTDDIPQSIHNGEKNYFKFNNVLSDKDVLVEGDGSTVVNVYYTRNYYTITFKAPGKCTIPAGHTHTDACYNYVCVGNHSHTAECLVCELTPHTHSAACCTLENHVHSAECCSLDEHAKHDSSCCVVTVHAAHNAGCCTLEEHTHSWGCIFGCDKTEHTHGNGNCSCATPIHTHGDGKCSCDTPIHTHGDGKCDCDQHVHSEGGCTCALTEHKHGSACYNCGSSEHTHTDACKRLICRLETGHTHSSNCNNSSRTNTVKTVTRKYQASLDDIWHHGDGEFGLQDDNGVIYDSGDRWSPSDSSYYNQVLVYIANMPADDFTLTRNTSSNKTRTMYYYLQVLPGEEYDSTYDGRNYKLINTIYANYGMITEKEDFFDIKGYKKYASDPEFSGGQIGDRYTTAKFYYNRIVDHYLQFSNNGEMLDDRQKHGLMYGEALKDYSFDPPYPGNLEPNAYVFDQWYTSSGFYEGTEVDWDSLTMPEDDLLLYARWLPVTYDVYFYMDYEHLVDGEHYAEILDTPHGAKMESSISFTPSHSNKNYQFVGWFYIDGEGDKVAFNPSEMAVRQELHLYAEWSTKVVRQYTVSYAEGVWNEETGTIEPKTGDAYRALSADTTGYAFEAATRTFTAKPENQLENLSQEEWSNSIWVPHTNSHSILMKADNNENVFTFWYVPKTNIPYSVRYMDAATGERVVVDGVKKEDKVVDPNSDAVVTEQFIYVPGYIPDAFHKTLVLSAKDEENIITFYYTKDDSYEDDNDDGEPDQQSARYLIVHYIEEQNGSYSAYTTDDLIAVVGTEVSVTELAIPGFTFDHGSPHTRKKDGKNEVYGTVTTGAEGSEALKLELYYSRNKYSYTVEYLDEETRQSVSPTKVTGKDYRFDEVVTETAIKDIKGYDLFGSETQTLKISATESLNKITFLYTPKAKVVNYFAVCKVPGETGYGYPMTTSEYKEINGTTAVANPGFRFVGWYADEDCTMELTKDPFYKPSQFEEDVYEYNYYALFVPITLTITQTSGSGTTMGNDSGVYQVLRENGSVLTTVMLTGSESVTVRRVPAGKYTVQELTGNWTWTYEDVAAQSADLTTANGATVTFTRTAEDPDWLHGENHAEAQINKTN